jgi:hypothetical protein
MHGVDSGPTMTGLFNGSAPVANDNPMQQQATLGCGSLILIALIVLIFGRSNVNELEKEIKSLSGEVKGLKQSVDSQSVQLKDLREGLEKTKAK